MRDIILNKLAEMVKPVKTNKKPSEGPSEKDKAAHGEYLVQQEKEREPDDRDAEVEQMAQDYGYGKKEEAIAFRKDTVHGRAARKTAAETLRDVKSRMQKSGLAKKPGDAAKLTKEFSKENYKHREDSSTDIRNKLLIALAEAKSGKKVNPWAVCHASTGPEKSDKFERCVQDVKEKEGMKESSTNLRDRIAEALVKKLTEEEYDKMKDEKLTGPDPTPDKDPDPTKHKPGSKEHIAASNAQYARDQAEKERARRADRQSGLGWRARAANRRARW